MMRRMKFAIMAVTIISIFWGCSNEKKEIIKQTDNIYESNERMIEKKIEPYYIYSNNSNQPYWQGDSIKKVKNGYYYFYNWKLYFFDTSSKSAFLLCSSPDCDHIGDYCNANFLNTGADFTKGFSSAGLEVSDNTLYIMGYEKSEVTDFYLYSVSMDGTKREKMFYLYSTDEEYFFYEYKMHEKKLYSHINFEGKNYLGEISLDNKMESILDVSNYNGGDIENIVGYGDYIYFDATWYKDKKKTKLIGNIYRYNIKTKKLEIIMEDFVCNKFLPIDDTNIIYMNLSYDIIKKNIQTGEEKILSPSTGTFGNFSFDGYYLYVEDSIGSIVVFDLDGKQIDKIDINIGACLFGDSEYLFVQDMQPPVEREGAPELGFYALSKEQIGLENKDWLLLEEIE